MGMHRDDPNLDFDPIERNTRRQVFWSIYTFEKILCSILGRPTVIDDREMSMQIPDASMLEQQSMSAEFMSTTYKLIRMSYRIRQQAYFDPITAEERSPSLIVAERLLYECDVFFTTIPKHLALDFSPVPSDQRARILLLHVYYLYTRCIVSRGFLIQKVENSICELEKKYCPPPENWQRTLALSEDCVQAASKSIQCILAGANLGMIGYSWLDLFFIFHSVLIVCADFLARPEHQVDSPKDTERKNMVRAMLDYVRSMRKLAPTYKILCQIAVQFAGITGVADDHLTSNRMSTGPHLGPSPVMGEIGTTEYLVEISDIQEDWFANATFELGLDFFHFSPVTHAVAVPTNANTAYPRYYPDPTTSEVDDDWTSRTL